MHGRKFLNINIITVLLFLTAIISGILLLSFFRKESFLYAPLIIIAGWATRKGMLLAPSFRMGLKNGQELFIAMAISGPAFYLSLGVIALLCIIIPSGAPMHSVCRIIGALIITGAYILATRQLIKKQLQAARDAGKVPAYIRLINRMNSRINMFLPCCLRRFCSSPTKERRA